MHKISAVVITYNEAANIAPCVIALQKVAAEVLVIDSKSTDETQSIVKRLGAKLIETEWLGYSKTKNLGHNIAVNDWILSVDADEVLSDELIKNIQQIELDAQKIYSLDRLTNYCGQWIRHSGWYPDWKVRLFHKEHTKWEGDFVHERLKHTKALTVQKLQGKLFHYSYKTSEEHLARIEKYAKLSAAEMHSKGRKSTFIKLWISPVFRFFRTFFLKTGFLDGKNGWIISTRNAQLVHLKYKILRALNK